MRTSVDALSPTPIAVEERVLEDLLQELAQYWAEEYDWRAAERAMNAYEHYMVDVSGTRVHFMRKPGAGPDPVR